MKIVMALLVRDEEDILASNPDFHLQQGIDGAAADILNEVALFARDGQQ